MLCKDCGAPYAVTDNFCRRCGAALQVTVLPALPPGRALSLPWRPGKPTLVRGIAGLLLGAFAQLARREFQRRFLSSSGRSGGNKVSSSEKLPSNRSQPRPSLLDATSDGPVVSERVVFWERRIRYR